MKILVTGGLGYLGGRIARYLKDKNPNSQIFLTTRSFRPPISQWCKEFEIVSMDVRDEESIEACLAQIQPELIIHLAALNAVECAEYPELAHQVNTQGTRRILKLAAQKGVQQLIYFSTIHIYGALTDRMITEETQPQPLNPYAATHYEAEQIIEDFSRQQDLQTLIFRLSNGYGYPMHKAVNTWNLVFNAFCKSSVLDQKIIINSSGKQNRDFIALADVVRAVQYFAYDIPDRWAHEVYNLGGQRSLSVLEVAQAVAKNYENQYGQAIGIETENAVVSPNDDLPIQYSIDKLLQTGFSLNGDMDQEITKTFAVCEEFRK